ncbi:MAG: DUF5916 domain-containing protein [Vicinamibacterales bacterium]
MSYLCRLRAEMCVAAFLAAGSLAHAQEVPHLTAGQLADGARPTVDGRVDDAVWATAPVYSTFTQQEPNEGQPASERTEVRFLIDRRTLYIGVVSFDSEPDKIVVSQSRRDAELTDTDSIQILLDTYNDGQNAFVFGTNPFAIEYDGQVMGEGQTSGASGRAGGGGSQSGQVSGFNPNWDADWTVRASTTARGWEAEFAIPLKTVRYSPGANRTWGVNVMRIIRRRNEQSFLAPVPRGYTLHRVSVAAKLDGLTLAPQRDLKVIPFGVGSVNDDKSIASPKVDRSGAVGVDAKWGVRPGLTLDLTVNTDFAQVEADEQQVNLTRFPLFFPEKRPFFLENAQTFQLGQPQAIDLFFPRRIGLSKAGAPIDIMAGGRLSGRVGQGYNIGLLNMQTDEGVDASGKTTDPRNNFTVMRVQRELGRSNIGAMFVNRQGVGRAAQPNDFNRAYGVDTAWQTTKNGKLFAFLARTDSPAAKGGSDYAGRAYYTYANPLWNGAVGYAQVGDAFNPEVGFLPRRAYRQVEGRYFLTYQPKQWPWIRRISPHASYNAYANLSNRLESSRGHWHFFEVQPRQGGRFGYYVDTQQDRPLTPFTVYQNVVGRKVTIPAGEYSWLLGVAEYFTDPSARFSTTLRWKTGGYYDGDYRGWETTFNVRLGVRLLSSLGWNRDDITLPYGSFKADLLPLKVTYSFTNLASVTGLIQYNSQTSSVSSNIRLALLERSGTGLFVVYNDRRDTSALTRETLLGRSFIVKYTRLLNF